MGLWSVKKRVGVLSDLLTLRFLARRAPTLPRLEITQALLERIRKAQADDVAAGARAFSVLNGLAIFAALTILLGSGLPYWVLGGWTVTGLAITLLLVRAGCRPATAQGQGSPKGRIGALLLLSGSGAVHWSALTLALVIWNIGLNGPLVLVLVAALAIWSLAFVAIALAGYGFVVIVTLPALIALLWQQQLDQLLLALPFALIAIAALAGIARQNAAFLTETLRREEAEAQRNVISMLIGDHQEVHSAWLWRCDTNLLLRDMAPGLLTYLGVEGLRFERMPLRGLLGRAGAQPAAEADSDMLRRLSGAPDALPDQCEIRLRVSGGTVRERILSFYMRRSRGGTGAIVGFEGFARDITDEHHAREAAEYLANHDIMTGLLNTPAFHQRALARLEEARRQDQPGAVVFLFIDADNLKSVNDTYGHSAGDALIRTLARRLTTNIGAAGLVARKGGDEFLACVFDLDSAGVEDYCVRLHRDLCRDFEFDGGHLELSCSIGVARASAVHATLPRLEVEADRALYFAKHKGRRRLEHYNTELGEKLLAERRVAHDLPAAIRSEQIRCVFQPVVRLSDHKIVGCEALVRWDHPQFGTIHPEQVIAAARHTQCTGALGALVLRRTLEAVRDWPADIHVSVNAVAHELTERGYHAHVLEALDRAGVSPSRLCIEITESELLENSVQVISNLTLLRKAGVRIAVDDFGAGYSSLNYLPQYPNDVIKIDRSLIYNSARSETGPLILNAVATMTRALNVIAVAEGVETESDLKIVRDAGFNLVQGYYFYKPMGQEELLGIFSKQGKGFDNAHSVTA